MDGITDELRAERLESLRRAADGAPTPVPMFLTCPKCNARHIDEGDFATKPHHTHSCQACGLTWRPAVVPTVGVAFLPGFKNEKAEPMPGAEEEVATLRRQARAALEMCNERDETIERLRKSEAMLMQGLNVKERERRAHRDALQAWADAYAMVRPTLVAGRLAREDALWDACMGLGLRVPLVPCPETAGPNSSAPSMPLDEVQALVDFERKAERDRVIAWCVAWVDSAEGHGCADALAVDAAAEFTRDPQVKP